MLYRPAADADLEKKTARQTDNSFIAWKSFGRDFPATGTRQLSYSLIPSTLITYHQRLRIHRKWRHCLKTFFVFESVKMVELEFGLSNGSSLANEGPPRTNQPSKRNENDPKPRKQQKQNCSLGCGFRRLWVSLPTARWTTQAAIPFWKKKKQTNKRSSSGGDSLSVSPAPDSMHRSSQTESSPLQNLEIQYPLRCLEIKGPTPKNKKVSYEFMRWTTRRQPSSKLRAPFFWNLLHNLRFNTPTQPRNSGANT